VGLAYDCTQQLGSGAETVVDRKAGDARPARHSPDVESRAAAGRDQLPGGRQHGSPGPVDSRLTLAEIMTAVHARTLTYSLSTEHAEPIVRFAASTTYHPVPMRLPDPLALRELTALLRDPVFRGRGVPHGDGRPVLLVPGFLSGDWALTVLRTWLERIGYRAYVSGIYFNVRASEHMVAGLRHRLAEIQATDPSRVTLVGHSRGGLLAKVLAQRRPDAIEQVIALGSPLADQSDITPLTQAAVGVVRTANEIGFGLRMRQEGRFAYDLAQPPAVPTTSIYTRSDDVVNFRSCIRPDIPSIAVWGSHNGLVVNPEVYRLLGRLLARRPRSR
jgi:pimeloyl-ACP methyl ester carboxylesterase